MIGRPVWKTEEIEFVTAAEKSGTSLKYIFVYGIHFIATLGFELLPQLYSKLPNRNTIWTSFPFAQISKKVNFNLFTLTAIIYIVGERMYVYLSQPLWFS